jgi:AAA+ ATPase superfamily predicted ATPase
MLLREHEHEIFTGRDEILATLRHNADLFQQGRGANIALVGPRRIGKTMIAQRFADEIFERRSSLIPVYFNVADNLSVPSVFAIRLMASISQSFIEADGEHIESSGGIINAARLLSIAGQTREETVISSAQKLAKEMEKDRPNERLLLEISLSCLEEVAHQTGRKPIVILDEFHSLTQFDSFPNIKETLNVLGPIFSQQIDVGYIIASSNTNMVKRIVQSESSPLFNQFQIVHVPPFDRAAIADYCHKSLPEQLVTPENIARLFSFTGGNPFYLSCLTTVMRRLYREETNDDILTLAIYENILMKDGRIYQYCQYRVEMTLAEARGKTTLRSVLLVLAEEGKQTLSEIASQLKRSPGEVRSYLKRLAGFDLIGRNERRYYITDLIIAQWIKFTILERTPEFSDYESVTQRYLDHNAEKHPLDKMESQE